MSADSPQIEQNPPQPSPGHQKSLSVSGRKEWVWSAAKEKAARLLAIDDLSDERIAQECNTVRRVLARWKLVDQFQARVQQHRNEYRAKVLDSKYCRKEQRIQLRQQLIDKCVEIIQQRAGWPGMEKIPGGTTGLVKPQVRQLGGGRIVTEYSVDAALEQVIRSNLREIAHEVGDWKSINDHTGGGDGGGPSTTVVFQVSATQMRVAGDRIIEGQALVVDAGPDRSTQAVLLQHDETSPKQG